MKFVLFLTVIFIFGSCVFSVNPTIKEDSTNSINKENKTQNNKQTYYSYENTKWVTTPKKSKYEEPIEKQFLVNLASISTRSSADLKSTFKSSQREKLVQFAKRYIGHKKIPNFRDDCSGYVRMVFNHFGIDIFKLPIELLRRANGDWLNGTEVIYRFVREYGHNFVYGKPQPGDFIYFDNTHDRNNNGKLDDLFTHVAIVTKVDEDGTIEYIHRSNPGVNIQVMHPDYPNQPYRVMNGKKKRINSALRAKKKSDSPNTPRYSGQMLRGFGTLFPKGDNLITEDPKKTKKKDKSTSSETDKNKEKQALKNKLEKEKKEKDSLEKQALEKQKQKKEKELEEKALKEKLEKEALAEKLKKEKEMFSIKKIDKNRCIKRLSNSQRKNVVLTAEKYKNKKIKDSIQLLNIVFSRLDCNLEDIDDKTKGIEKIYWFVNKYGSLFSSNYPKEGDLIFFDGTNDITRTAPKSDHYSNLGIILNVDSNGTAEFIYVQNGKAAIKKINKRYWNKHKIEIEGKEVIVNDYMRKPKKSDRVGTKYLTGEFIRRFGSIYKR